MTQIEKLGWNLTNWGLSRCCCHLAPSHVVLLLLSKGRQTIKRNWSISPTHICVKWKEMLEFLILLDDANRSSRNKWFEDFTVATISPETDAIRAIANVTIVRLLLSSAIWICGLPYPFFYNRHVWLDIRPLPLCKVFKIWNKLKFIWNKLTWSMWWVMTRIMLILILVWIFAPKLSSFTPMMSNKAELRGERTLNWSRLYPVLKRRV